MSFQAYLDNIEEKTGKTPNEFIAMAKEKGYDSPDTKAGVIVDWLKQDFGLGRGHAMALVYVIENGAKIGDKHVGTTGVHRDESDTLRLEVKRTHHLWEGFTDAEQAALYDQLHPPQERNDFRFYLPMILAADAVLDVGCGTGALLHMAREAGHSGRLVGLDPAVGMLEQARRRSDIEWILGDLSDVPFDREFGMAVMTGHAFQELTTDDEARAAFAAVRSALTDDGRFCFETRNPAARAWEGWTPEHGTDFTDADGRVFHWEADVELPVTGDLVRFRASFSGPRWSQPQDSVSTLRFLDAPSLNALLADAGLAVEDQYGYWDRSVLTDASPEIITIASVQAR